MKGVDRASRLSRDTVAVGGRHAEDPKVSAVAISHMSDRSFAAALDRAIQRSQSPLVMNSPPALAGPTASTIIEHSAEELRGPMARLERRF